MTIEQRLLTLNSNPDLNEKNVIELMCEILHIMNSSKVNHRHPHIIDLGSHVFAQGCTLLHIATALNCDRIAGFLIEAGEDVNSKDCYKRTPLHYAAMYNSAEATKVLLDKKADIYEWDFLRNTPLQLAIARDSLKVAKLLTDESKDRSLRYKKENDIDLFVMSVAVIGFVVTLGSLIYAAPSAIEEEACLLIFGIVLASLASAAVFGGITYGIAYIWSKHELSSTLDKMKVDEVKCDNSQSQQPT